VPKDPDDAGNSLDPVTSLDPADPVYGAGPGAAPERDGGVDLAREALAAARVQAARRGSAAAGRAGSGRGGTGARRERGGSGSTSRRSGSGPDERDPQRLGAAVGRLLADRGWQTEAAVGGVLGRWAEVVGTDLAAHCSPETYEDGVLAVRADSTAWATQLRLLSPQLVRTLNEHLGAGTVHRVNVLGPVGPSWRRGPRSVKGRGPRDTYG
jgi:predicted nucleic acid-binding Zn ribbon protein